MTDDSPQRPYSRIFWEQVGELRRHLGKYVDGVKAAEITAHAFQRMWFSAVDDRPTRWGPYQYLYASTEFSLRRAKQAAGSYLPVSYRRNLPVPCRLKLCEASQLFAAIHLVATEGKLSWEESTDAAAGLGALIQRDLYVGRVWYGHDDLSRGALVLNRLVDVLNTHSSHEGAGCSLSSETWMREDVRSQIWRRKTLEEGRYPADGCSHEARHPHHPHPADGDGHLVGDGPVRVAEPELGTGTADERATDVRDVA